MSPEELQDVLNWIAEPGVLTNLPMDEQLCIQMALLKMCESIKPIYDKHNKKNFIFGGKL